MAESETILRKSKLASTMNGIKIFISKVKNMARDDSNFFSNEGYDENFNDDFNNGDENEGDFQDDEENFLSKNEALYAIELDHLKSKLTKETNLALLDLAVKISKTSFFWYFKSPVSKVRTINYVYNELIQKMKLENEETY